MEVPRKCKPKHSAFVAQAAALAAKSTMTHKHGCVIVYNGLLIASGYNTITTGFQGKYSIHAEQRALMQVAKKFKHVLPLCDMYVVRLAPPSSGTGLKMSKPCSECQRAIRIRGVGRVYYSG